MITDPHQARRAPELAVLSTLAHAGRSDPYPLFEALFAGLEVVDTEHSEFCTDLILTALPIATRKLLEESMSTSTDRFHSEFMRRLVRQGLAEGQAKGMAEALVILLEARGVALPDEARAKISGCTDIDQLDLWIKRAGNAERLEDLGGPLGE